jgi:hypothetical protein
MAATPTPVREPTTIRSRYPLFPAHVWNAANTPVATAVPAWGRSVSDPREASTNPSQLRAVAAIQRFPRRVENQRAPGAK